MTARLRPWCSAKTVRPDARRSWAFALGFMAAILFVASPASAQNAPKSKYAVLVQAGDPVPGSTEDFTFLSGPVLSANGGWAAFAGSFTGPNGQGLFRISLVDGSISKIIEHNDPLSGANANLSFSSRLSVNSGGTVAFNMHLSGTGSTGNDTGIYAWDGSTIHQLVREGDPAPGGSGGTFPAFTATGFSGTQFRGINDQNQALFPGVIADSPNGTNDDSRFFRAGIGTAPQAIATEGDAAPNGGQYVQFLHPDMNDLGQAALKGTVGTANVGTKIWRMDADGSMHELVSAIVTGGTNTSVGQLRVLSGNASINNAGDVAFVGYTTAGGGTPGDTHVFRVNNGGGIDVLMSEGAAAPDGNGEFGNISTLNPQYNDAGQFVSNFGLINTSGGTSDDSGLFRIDSDGTVVQLFREGSAAPGGNGTFQAVNTSTGFALNNAGMVAMKATYQGTTGGNTDNQAIVATDGIDYFEIARLGNSLGTQTINSLDFNGGAYGNHRSTSGLNDYGQVSYYQTLSGGTRGIVLWTPELHHRGGVSDFDNGARWTLSLTPDLVHDVFLDANVDSTVTVNGTHTVNSLQVGGGAGMAQLIFTTGSSINVNQMLRLDTNGSIVMNGGASLDIGQLSGQGLIDGDATTTILINDLLSPGQSPGIIEFAGNLSLASSSTTLIELGGINTGEFDRVVGLNDLTIDGTLDVQLWNGFALTDGMMFEIFGVNGTSVGQFMGLSEGDLVGNFGGTDLFITYQAGSGNNVALYTSAVPEPGAIAFWLCLGTVASLGRSLRSASPLLANMSRRR